MARHRGRHKIRTTEIAGFPIREVRPSYWLIDKIYKGERIQKCFSDYSKASAWAQAKRRELERTGTDNNLSESRRRDAVAAFEKLEGTGYTVMQCVEDYLRRHPATGGQTVKQTCDSYIAAMKAGGRRPLSIYEKTLKFNLLCEEMGDRLTVSLEQADIDLWAKGRNTGAVTTEAYCGAGRDLLRFFARGGTLKERVIRDEAPPSTWDAATVQKVLAMAEQHTPDTVAALAVLFFAGLRPHEMMRLNWNAIDLETGVIRLTGSDTKTRSGRNVTITANLKSWLTAYRGTGPVAPSPARYRDQRETVMVKAGLTSWPVDVARHTFATMHYNLHSNVGATTKELGHRGSSAMFENHYRGVDVSPTQAAAYFAIKPAKSAKKVVQFQAAG